MDRESNWRLARKGARARRRTAALPYLVLAAIVAFIAFATWSALPELGSGDRLPVQETGGASLSSAPSAGGGARRGYPAPDFTFTLLDGKELTLSDLKGKAVVLNFWASWCPPCRAEARALERVWQAHKDRGVVFLGVDIQDTEQDARAFIKEFGITYPNGQDATTEIATSYGITGIPETFFITRDGKVARHWIGPIEEKQLAAFIEELLP